MRRLGRRCIDCGCEADASVVDEVKPMFRMEIVNFACGAVLKSYHSANGNIGRAVHVGCLADSDR
jgi:hypothetical protein